MSVATAELAEFKEMAALCRGLKARKRLCSGLRLVITDAQVIHALPLEPQVIPGAPPLDIGQMVKRQLATYQQLRHWLGEMFDIGAKEWNDSNIGKALATIESDLRAETVRVENYVASNGATAAYNVFTLVALGNSVHDLIRLVMSKGFKDMLPSRRLRALDEFAATFFRHNANRKNLQAMSIVAETILAIDDLYERGTNAAVEELITKQLKLADLEKLNGAFRAM